MTKTMHGKVHGRTIELDEDAGAPEGQEVEIQMRFLEPVKIPGLRLVDWLVP